MSSDASLISSKKLTGSVAGYIWNSPILKKLVYNPFIVSLLILSIICLIDFIYGKDFNERSTPISIAQHVITGYIIVASCVTMNNILIKHRYRLDKVAEAEAEGEVTSTNVNEQYISEYTDD